MIEVLTFVLAAPLAAMGKLAVGERRETSERPTRSATLGLVAACLGLDRGDELAHIALEEGYGLILRTDSVGPLLADYHTVQTPPARRGRRFATRAGELAVPDLETILSHRDYRTGLIALAGLWERLGEQQPARWPLVDLEGALRAPCFVPYLGRKCCPLMLPLAPRRITATDPTTALSLRAAERPAPELQLLQGSRQRPRLTMDAADADRFNLPIARRELSRDSLLSRQRWQFALREEAILEVPP